MKKHAISICNILILLYWLVDNDVRSAVLTTSFAALIVLSLASGIVVGRGRRFAELAGNLQISLFSVLMLLLGLEILHVFAPGVTPSQLRDHWLETNIADVRGRTIEFLEDSPYVKFKGNTLVRSQGNRGDSSQFCYEWHTDSLGFKNPQDLLASGRVRVVALGDSFTEGMGVCIADTWPAKLTGKGFPTYNLGVQGYAPTQMEGAFVQFGAGMKPAAVVIAYVGTIFDREREFLDTERAKKYRQFTGGIRSSLRAEGLEVRGQAKHLVSALYLLSTVAFRAMQRQWENRQNERDIDVVFTPFSRYAAEILGVGKDERLLREIESNPTEWQSTLARFSSIAEKAKAIDAEVFLLYLPHRAAVYFSKATGASLPERFFEKREAALLGEFAAQQGMHFIDPFEKLVQYVQRIDEDTPAREYPYLEIDGHMSSVGYAIVTEEIANALGSLPALQPNSRK